MMVLKPMADITIIGRPFTKGYREFKEEQAMSRIGMLIGAYTVMVLCTAGPASGAGEYQPTPEEFRDAVRQYGETGRVLRPVTPQQPKALEQFKRAVALHTKSGATQGELKEAAALYQAAADAGMPPAATNLGLMYLEGKGVKKDLKKALALLNKAAGNNDSQADVVLGRLYLIGKDVKRDEKKGEMLLSKAAKAGNQNAVKMLTEYREWKKKNELAQKEYQELLKKVQAAPGRSLPTPVTTFPPVQTVAPSSAGLPFPMKNRELPVPVIPGYSHFGVNRTFSLR